MTGPRRIRFRPPPSPDPVSGPPEVSVVIPYERSGDPHREAAYRWVTTWWAEHHPGYEVVTGTCPVGSWSKGVAVADGLARATGPIVIYADADVWCDSVQAAVDAVREGAGWATPHKRVKRLTAAATAQVIAGERPCRIGGYLAEPPYLGCPAGGIVVASREVHEEVPVDPRFMGWGQEDEARTQALTRLVGPPHRVAADLWHLWHRPPTRQTRKWGSEESRAMYRRYSDARTVEAMRAVLVDARTAIQEAMGVRT